MNSNKNEIKDLTETPQWLEMHGWGDEDEIKGLSGVSLPELYSGGPFHISGKLTGVGCVNILADTKQARSPHLRKHSRAGGRSY